MIMEAKEVKTRKISAVEGEIHSLVAYMRNRVMISDRVLDEIIAGYTMPTILKIVAELAYGNTSTKFLNEREREYLIKRLLIKRRRLLNADFEWTEDNRVRFLNVNNNIYELCKMGWREALKTAEILEKRIKSKDSFLKDYEIQIKINAYPKITGIKRDIAEYIESYLAEETLPEIESISHCHYKSVTLNDKDFPKYMVDDNTNWNIEYFGDNFKDDYICYLIHCMLDTGVWSFKDIISIESVWVDVEVTHQHSTDIPKMTEFNKE